jgi:ABC-type multidrug transport system fused ATPase/permease subunit
MFDESELQVSGRGQGDSSPVHLDAEEQHSLSPRESLRILIKSWRFIRPHCRLVALKCVLALAPLPILILIPWPLKIIIDNVINGHRLEGVPRRLLFQFAGNDRLMLLALIVGLLFIGALLIGVASGHLQSLDANVASGGLDQASVTANQANDGWSLFGGLFGMLEVWATIVLTQRLNQTVRTTAYESFLRAPLNVFADQKIGDAVFRVMYDSAAIGEVLYSGVLTPLISITTIVLTIAVLWGHFRSEPLIPVLATLTLPTVVLASAVFGRRLRDQSQRMREQGSAMMAAIEERLSKVHLIKAFGRESSERAAIDAESQASFSTSLMLIVLVMAIVLLVAPALGLLAALAVYHLMSEVIANRITLGDVALLAGYGMMLARPMMALGSVWIGLQAPIAGMRRIHSVLDRMPCESAPAGNSKLLQPIREIEFINVSAGYLPKVPVVQSVSVHFDAGELVAIAGASGAGKTTLVNCIPGFLEPSSGEILINGIDSRSLAPGDVRQRIALVFQDEALFSATIADNISYGLPDAPMAAVRRAAALAGAAEFIEAMPQGYLTLLGRRGSRLSAGQKQRVAIARALLREPDVLILDEPMAPLDRSTERSLIEILRELARKRIVIIVAHRPETLASCGRVYLLSEGRLRASGSHAELIKSSSDYHAYLAMNTSANGSIRMAEHSDSPAPFFDVEDS